MNQRVTSKGLAVAAFLLAVAAPDPAHAQGDLKVLFTPSAADAPTRV